jgi:hypothetical protein
VSDVAHGPLVLMGGSAVVRVVELCLHDVVIIVPK